MAQQEGGDGLGKAQRISMANFSPDTGRFPTPQIRFF